MKREVLYSRSVVLDLTAQDAVHISVEFVVPVSSSDPEVLGVVERAMQMLWCQHGIDIEATLEQQRLP